MNVPRDLSVHYYALYSIHYNTRCVIMLILLGPQNKRYNEVSVYKKN